jgi:hypothetical protein
MASGTVARDVAPEQDAPVMRHMMAATMPDIIRCPNGLSLLHIFRIGDAICSNCPPPCPYAAARSAPRET